MNFINNNINNDEGCPLLPELFPLETVDLFPTFNDIAALNDQITTLSIDVNTLALRIEIERNKLIKMRMVLKRVKQGMTPTDWSLLEMRRDVDIIKEQLGAIRNIYESELARIGLTTYKCFAWLHQILLAIIPCTTMPEAEHIDSSQLLYELLWSITQMKTPNDHPSSIEFYKYMFHCNSCFSVFSILNWKLKLNVPVSDIQH